MDPPRAGEVGIAEDSMLKKLAWLFVAVSQFTIYTYDIQLATANDTTAPVLSSLTFPGSDLGNKVGGKVQFEAMATDNVGVSRVEFYKGATLLATDISSPYECVVNFNLDATGTDYVVKAVAYDAANNSSYKSVTVNKPAQNMRGSGATLAENGYFFRVWAPHASEVQLIGNFNALYNNGALGVHYLTKDTDGYWFGFVPGAAAGNLYKYALLNPGGPDNNSGQLYRLDPLGKDSMHSYNGSSPNEQAGLSYNASIIVDTTYPWAPFNSPSYNDYIIYQLHIGSFAGMNDGLNMTDHGGDGKVAWFSDVETKLQYIKAMGFNAIELLPVCEFSRDRSWGYNIALYNTPESAYGAPRTNCVISSTRPTRKAWPSSSTWSGTTTGRRTALSMSSTAITRTAVSTARAVGTPLGAEDRRGGSRKCRTSSSRMPGCSSRITRQTACASTIPRRWTG